MLAPRRFSPRLLPLLLAAGCTAATVGKIPGTSQDSADTATHDTAHDDTADTDDTDSWTAPVWDPDALPASMPTVAIEIDAAAMARLDADPYDAPDERGVFVDGDGVTHEVDLSYRGAYALRNVMNRYDLRNWKVKFDGDDLYQGRREWNFNYEPHFRQKLAYDLFRFAGVAVPGAQHVVLTLNGEYQGMYLRYEDPDNKTWLAHEFGDDDGDLYKAAYDIPDQPQCFADLTVLGPDDADYVCHYAKKTNNNGDDETDFATLRAFISALNGVPNDELEGWIETDLALDSLRSTLVVGNFIANWDGYPLRPKNYWLYQDPRADRMVFIPWDLDASFGPDPDGTFNQMGATAPVFFDLLENDYRPVNDGEGTERPLVRRPMGLASQQAAYLARYRELHEGVLSAAYLEDRLDALTAIAEPELSDTDRERLAAANVTLRRFIRARSEVVTAELAE